MSESTAMVAAPRLPYHAAIQERYGVDKSGWKALVEAIFPDAQTTDAVVLALAYAKQRNLDVFKRQVHIVPIWNKKLRRLVETVWPGISELRTTAFRTGHYVGRDATAFGPPATKTWKTESGKVEVAFPEWAQITLYRNTEAGRAAFPGPRVYWLETFGTMKGGAPNSMWERRPSGQLEKCAEAGALRAAFPEEIGNDFIAEEVSHDWHGRPAVESSPEGKSRTEILASKIAGTEPANDTQRQPKEDPPYDPPTEAEQAETAPNQPSFAEAAGRSEPAADTQVNPEVDETDGVDAEVTEEQMLEGDCVDRLAMADNEQRIAELERDLKTDKQLPPAAKKRLAKAIKDRRAELTAK